MKKILLVLSLMLVVQFIISCADENNSNNTQSSVNNGDENIDLSTLTANESYKRVALLLYGDTFSDAEYNSLYTFLKGLETGSIFNSGLGIGEVTNGISAAVVMQSLYYFAQDAYDANTNTEITPLLYRSTFSSSEEFNKFISGLANYDNTALVNMLSPVVLSQNIINKSVETYLPWLLDASSSASQGSNTNINLTYDEFNVIVNVAYLFSYPVFNLTGLNITNEDIISSLMSTNLYNLNKQTKYKITYNHSIKYFRDNFLPQTATTRQLVVFSDVVKDALQNNGMVGGSPYKGDVNDAVLVSNPYEASSTDYTLYPLIAKTIYGSPYDATYSSDNKDEYLSMDNNPASNLAINNTLVFYQKLKTLGLKVPQISTSLSEHKNLAEITAVNLMDNGFIYRDFNQSADIFITNVLNVMFPTVISETSSVCSLVKEFNRAVEDAALSNADYAWIFDSSFSSANNPCNIAIE